MGELALVPGRRAVTWTLGRRAEESSGARLHFVRQRPGGNRPTGELSASRLSRNHLEIRLDGQGLAVSNVGRLALLVNNTPMTHVRVGAGDNLEIERELLLRCELRPGGLASAGHALHDFGGPDGDGIVGETPAARALRRQIRFSAAARGHVLIVGASGVGKELVARAIHRHSGVEPLVTRNAATFPEGILDAELFGNLKGYPNPGMPAPRVRGWRDCAASRRSPGRPAWRPSPCRPTPLPNPSAWGCADGWTHTGRTDDRIGVWQCTSDMGDLPDPR